MNDDFVFNQATTDKKLQEIIKLLENELDPVSSIEKVIHFFLINISFSNKILLILVEIL